MATAKLNHILNELSNKATWGEGELTTALLGIWNDLNSVKVSVPILRMQCLITSFTECFSKDVAIRVDFCLRAVMPTDRTVLQMLTYARDSVSRQEGSDLNTKGDLVRKVHGAIRRLGTYQLINANPFLDEEVDSEVGGFDGKEWQRFRTSDMVGEMRDYARVGNLRAIVLIWRRHHLGESDTGISCDQGFLNFGW